MHLWARCVVVIHRCLRICTPPFGRKPQHVFIDACRRSTLAVVTPGLGLGKVSVGPRQILRPLTIIHTKGYRNATTDAMLLHRSQWPVTRRRRRVTTKLGKGGRASRRVIRSAEIFHILRDSLCFYTITIARGTV